MTAFIIFLSAVAAIGAWLVVQEKRRRARRRRKLDARQLLTDIARRKGHED